MHYLYLITNQKNNKNYIGQTINPEYRWRQHKAYANQQNSPQYIHRAMAKHGIDNFTFTLIATCLTLNDANETERVLIIQYKTQDKNYGYNIKAGGNVEPHSEETKQKLRAATLNQIATQGHPAQGTKRTDEQKAKMSAAQKSKDNAAIYTQEVRERFSKAHIGIKDSDETKSKKSNSAKEAWNKRIDYSRKCEAPGCEASGKVKYKIINGFRYCNKHGLRVLRNGTLENKTK